MTEAVLDSKLTEKASSTSTAAKTKYVFSFGDGKAAFDGRDAGTALATASAEENEHRRVQSLAQAGSVLRHTALRPTKYPMRQSFGQP